MLRETPPKIAFFDKPPKVKESVIKKKWVLGCGHRKKFILDNEVVFFIRPDFIYAQFQAGSDGSIIPAYNSPNGLQARYVVKVVNFHKKAAHEAKYHRMLGRRAYWFKWESATALLADWQQGVPLWAASELNIATLSFADRLQCLSSGLAELDILHSNGRGHFDIAGRNLILDIEKFKISLIDFSSSKKASSESLLVDVERYATNLKGSFFPDIYDSRYRATNQTFSIMEEAILILINQMSTQHYPNYKQPCSSKLALRFCLALLENQQTLNSDMLEKIENEIFEERTLRFKGC